MQTLITRNSFSKINQVEKFNWLSSVWFGMESGACDTAWNI